MNKFCAKAIKSNKSNTPQRIRTKINKMSTLSIPMNGVIEKAVSHVAEAILSEARACWCERGEDLSVEELMRNMRLTESKKKSKKSEKKSESNIRKKPNMVLPFCGVIEESWCKGVRFNHGLHTQCTNGMINGSVYCKTCKKSADNSASGKPTYGDIRDRMEGELLEYRDPKGRQTTCYANVAKKLNLNLEQACACAGEYGWTIPENQLTEVEKKRGRPASNKPKEVKKGKRGRPKKVVVESEVSMEDQISQLVSEAAEGLTNDTKSASKKVLRIKQAPKKKGRKPLSEEEKAARLAAKEAEKAKKKAEREAKKAAKLAEKEAEKAKKKAEREAKKASQRKAALELADKLIENKKVESKTTVEWIEPECSVSVTTFMGNSKGEVVATTYKEKNEIDDVVEKMGSLTVDSTPAIVEETPAIVEEAPVTVEEAPAKEEETPAIVEEAPVTVEMEEEEVEEEISIDPETTPKVTVNGEEYYSLTAFGYENVLFSMEGDLVGILDTATNEIQEVELE